MKAEYTVRVVTFREGDWHVAQCLEWDLATQARTEEELSGAVQRLLLAQLDAAHRTGREPFANLPAAPLRFHKMWEATATPPATVPLVSEVPAHLLLRAAS